MRTIVLGLMLMMSITFSFAQNEIQRVRVNFENPEGFSRQLLLGFVPDNSATDGLDYGYDAINIDDLSNDLNWIIEDERYVIQGVGAFNENKYYPLGLFLSNSGDVKISLHELENFDEVIDVYLYDLELDEYTLLNDVDYLNSLAAETYLDRFFITFSNSVGDTISEEVLSVTQNNFEELKIWHSSFQNELHIDGISNDNNTLKISLYTVNGKQIWLDNVDHTTSNSIIVPTSNISTGIYIVSLETEISSYSSKVYIEK
ncbi:T9SS type A sorting domain-containing protein [uncultured Winogradskyella sp.]|uniref:T9SS type A sorting domain-containing protein n=1 Tax=uncultured Winogradskyella sp. TaxID=395353 RepID=UPI0026332D38|nr:T9SS type A sorting domain-containing protein [uncultured Winogradskyella sp.]